MRVSILLLLPAMALGVPYPPQCSFIETMPFFKSSARSTASVTQEVEMLTEFARFAQSRVPVLLAEFARYRQILDAEPQALLRGIRRKPRARLFDWPRAYAQRQVNSVTPSNSTIDNSTMTESTMASSTMTESTMADTSTANPTSSSTPGSSDDELEREIQDAIKTIVDTIKETFESIEQQPLSVDTLVQIGAGVIKGVKDIATDIGFELPDKLPNFPNFPDFPDIDFSNIKLPELNLPDIGLPELDFDLKVWPLVCKAIWWPMDDKYCQSVRCSACSPAMIAAARACELNEGSVNHFCLRKVLGDRGCNFCAIDFLNNQKRV